MPDNLVTISDLSFKRGGRLIFGDVNIAVKRGKITAIMGPSGSGKTTLLRLIGGQLLPEAGSIIVDGADIHRLPRKSLYEARKKMGLLFQANALFTHLSVFDNVAFPLREHTSLNPAMIRDVVLMKLEAVGLRGTAHMMPDELSGGMARRVALARTIALDPQLMMYDEPFTGQDPIIMGVLSSLIRKLTDVLGIASIVVSHDIQETLAIADYAYVLSQGEIIGAGTPSDILASSSPELYQFVHGVPDGVVPFHFPAKAYEEDLLL